MSLVLVYEASCQVFLLDAINLRWTRAVWGITGLYHSFLSSYQSVFPPAFGNWMSTEAPSVCLSACMSGGPPRA